MVKDDFNVKQNIPLGLASYVCKITVILPTYSSLEKLCSSWLMFFFANGSVALFAGAYGVKSVQDLVGWVLELEIYPRHQLVEQAPGSTTFRMILVSIVVTILCITWLLSVETNPQVHILNYGLSLNWCMCPSTVKLVMYCPMTAEQSLWHSRLKSWNFEPQ